MSVSSRLSQINIYPVKSIKGISLSTSWVEKQGIVFDRRFMLADSNGNMITARTYPQLVKVKANITPAGLWLSYEDKPPLTVSIAELDREAVKAQVWKDTFIAYSTSVEANRWFTSIIGLPVQLLYCGEQSNREREKLGHNVSFADGYPLLVISEASLNELNKRSSEHHLMAQFRPNLVVSGVEPFVEDSWKRIKIGNVEFEVRKPCERCVLTTVDTESGQFNASGEPLKTLSQFRADEEGRVYFGQNLVALNEGSIEAGDVVTVLAYQEKVCYQDKGDQSRGLKLICTEIEVTAKDFVTYWFEAPDGGLPDYLPGQYLPIETDINGESYLRYYTLSSSPSRPGRYAISVKRVNDGKVSNYLLDNMQIGKKLVAEAPEGAFYLNQKQLNQKQLNQKQPHPLLFLSAGSGITPMISMLRFLADNNQIKDVVFYHQCSTIEDIPFKQELDAIQEAFPGLQLIISLSQAHQEWQGVKGRLTLSHLKPIPDLDKREAFVCGPTPFMQKAKNLLLKLGLKEACYHEESFGVDASLGSDTAHAVKELTIEFNGKTFSGDNQTSLLNQIENNGHTIASSCRAGLCGACMVTLQQGEVEQQYGSALTEQDKAEGKILACCSRPETDLKVVRGS